MYNPLKCTGLTLYTLEKCTELILYTFLYRFKVVHCTFCTDLCTDLTLYKHCTGLTLYSVLARQKTVFTKSCYHTVDQKHRICELCVYFREIEQIQAADVFGVIFLIFIEFEWRGRRRSGFTKYVFGNVENRSAISLLSSLFETVQ